MSNKNRNNLNAVPQKDDGPQAKSVEELEEAVKQQLEYLAELIRIDIEGRKTIKGWENSYRCLKDHDVGGEHMLEITTEISAAIVAKMLAAINIVRGMSFEWFTDTESNDPFEGIIEKDFIYNPISTVNACQEMLVFQALAPQVEKLFEIRRLVSREYELLKEKENAKKPS
jgi:hypothetical protein